MTEGDYERGKRDGINEALEAAAKAVEAEVAGCTKHSFRVGTVFMESPDGCREFMTTPEVTRVLRERAAAIRAAMRTAPPRSEVSAPIEKVVWEADEAERRGYLRGLDDALDAVAGLSGWLDDAGNDTVLRDDAMDAISAIKTVHQGDGGSDHKNPSTGGF